MSRARRDDVLLPAHWQTLDQAQRAWHTHHEAGLRILGRTSLIMPDSTVHSLDPQKIEATADGFRQDHQPVMRRRRADSAYCSGCARTGDYRRCPYAGWLRCWLLWDGLARNHSTVYDSGLVADSHANSDSLKVTIDLPPPMGLVPVIVDREGLALGPHGSIFDRIDLLRAELRRVLLLHKPIGPAGDPPPPVGPHRLCRECVRHGEPVQYHDLCAWRRFTFAWRGAPSWLWSSIGKRYRDWPAQAKAHFNKGTTAPITARSKLHPTEGFGLNRNSTEP